MVHNGFLEFQSGLDLNFNSMTYGFLCRHAKGHHEPRQLVFSQLMAFLPVSTFRRCVATHRGDHKVQDFTCMDQFLTIAFAQLT